MNLIESGLPTPVPEKDLRHRYSACRQIYLTIFFRFHHPSYSFLIITRFVLLLFTVTSLLFLVMISLKKKTFFLSQISYFDRRNAERMISPRVSIQCG